MKTVLLLVAFLCGCATTTPVKPVAKSLPPVPSSLKSNSQAVFDTSVVPLFVQQPQPQTWVMNCYFPTIESTVVPPIHYATGIVQASADLVIWTNILSAPYLTSQGWSVSVTNMSDSPNLYFREALTTQ